MAGSFPLHSFYLLTSAPDDPRNPTIDKPDNCPYIHLDTNRQNYTDNPTSLYLSPPNDLSEEVYRPLYKYDRLHTVHGDRPVKRDEFGIYDKVFSYLLDISEYSHEERYPELYKKIREYDQAHTYDGAILVLRSDRSENEYEPPQFSRDLISAVHSQ